MKAVTIYYSYSGKSKKAAENMAKKRATDLIELKDEKQLGKIAAYTAGCFKALTGKTAKLSNGALDLEKYERIILIGPVWAGKPAPAINNVLEVLPARKKVEVSLVSGSGNSKGKEYLTKKIRDKGSVMVKYQDVKASSL